MEEYRELVDEEEPTHYSFDDLVRDKKTSWTGVRNALAQKHLRSIQKATVSSSITRVTRSRSSASPRRRRPLPDPADPDGKLYAVDVAPVKKLESPVTLAAIKADKSFASFPLVRMARLSVMPVTDDEWERIEKMSNR